MKKFTSLAIALSFAFVFSLIAEIHSKVSTYEECVAAGNIVLKTYPAKCVTKDRQSFWQDINKPVLSPSLSPSLCENRCGDGACQEIVCMGEGCPCSESKENCPKDC